MNEFAGDDYIRKLQQLADEHAEEYQRITPFAHIYLKREIPRGIERENRTLRTVACGSPDPTTDPHISKPEA